MMKRQSQRTMHNSIAGRGSGHIRTASMPCVMLLNLKGLQFSLQALFALGIFPGTEFSTTL